MKNIKEKLKRIKDKIKDQIKDTENPNYIDWIIFGLVALFLFSCFIYWDILVTTSHATNYIEAISSGRILDLYRINYNFPVQGELTTVCYDIPIYILFMIWNLPLWIVNHFYNIDITNNFLCMLWMKGILILFLALSGIIIKKICQEMSIKKSYIKWIILIFVSSPVVFSSIFILCQYDIIAIFFMLIGLLAYIKGDQNKFLLWFSIAIPMKLFPLFIFIPLLLLKEKRILQIISNLLASIFCLSIFRIIELKMPDYLLSTQSFNTRMLDKLLNSSTLRINLGSASLFIAAYVIICIYCYIKEVKDKDELYKYSIYIPFAVYITLFLFINFHPYWLVYITPFFPILLFQNSKYFKVNLLIETIFNFIILFTLSHYFTWCFGAKQVNGMLISKIFGTRTLTNLKLPYVASIYSMFGLQSYQLSAFYGVFLAISICILIINSPKLNIKQFKFKIERTPILLRTLLIIPLAILMIWCYYS